MRNLVPRTGPLIVPYDLIVVSKYKGVPARLRRLRPMVLQRYGEYDKLKQMLEQISASVCVGAEKDDLLDCYDNPTEALNRLKADIKQGQPVYGRCVCAYCGIDSPGEVEHYLPKSEFPEFSVCHYNLLPACSICNRKKRVKWREDGVRRILHLYFDKIPSGSQWLQAEVSVEQDTPVAVFSLDVSSIADVDQQTMILAHYDILNLLNRYSERAAEVFTEVEVDVLKDSTAEGLEEQLRRKAARIGSRHGVNFWKSVLYRSMADSEDLIPYLLRQAASDEA